MLFRLKKRIFLSEILYYLKLKVGPDMFRSNKIPWSGRIIAMGFLCQK